MSKLYGAALLSLALLVPASARAQDHGEPFVLVTPTAGPSGYVHVKVGICYNRTITTYIFWYGETDFSSYMSSSSQAPPGWCTDIYPDPSYEEWNGDVPELCGENWFNVQVVDAWNYGGGDNDHSWAGPSCLTGEVASSRSASAFAAAACADPLSLALRASQPSPEMKPLWRDA